MLTKEQEFLLNSADQITDPEAKNNYLDRLQVLYENHSKANTTYNRLDILNRNNKNSN